MTERVPYRVLYLNGLGEVDVDNPGKPLARYLKSPNVWMTHMVVDWQSNLTFHELFDRITMCAEREIRQHGRLALVGASAGGSLGVNVFQRLRSDNPYSDLALVGLSCRLKVGDLKDLRDNAPDFTGKKSSAAYVESVSYCEETAVPQLTESDKQSMRTVRPMADQVVPLDAMGIDGVDDYIVPVSGHLHGIARGLRLVPEILDAMYDHQ